MDQFSDSAWDVEDTSDTTETATTTTTVAGGARGRQQSGTVDERAASATSTATPSTTNTATSSLDGDAYGPLSPRYIGVPEWSRGKSMLIRMRTTLGWTGLFEWERMFIVGVCCLFTGMAIMSITRRGGSRDE